MMFTRFVLLSILLSICGFSFAQEGPRTFREAKILGKQHIYLDQNKVGDLYCGCQWQWAGESGGVMDLQSCGYQIRKQPNRANRIEWEHIMPAATFGRQRQCWQNGGRDNCTKNDPIYSKMEADLHNLYPSVGEVNADRSNYNYGMALSLPIQYGQCQTKVDFQNRLAEPRAQVKGMVARVNFYMADRYNLNLSNQQQQLLMAWDRAFPVTPWEVERDRRTSLVMGWSNPFVTKQKIWVENFRPSGWGVPRNLATPPAHQASPQGYPYQATVPTHSQARQVQQYGAPSTSSPSQPPLVIGNKNSMIYHVYNRCPSYDKVSSQSKEIFQSESDAVKKGYRIAKNCR